jgi:hypothetical protein
MDRYDFIIAREKEVLERQRQEEVEDNDIRSDSELSELASSIFDGMDIDMDGQDDQDGQGDTGSRVGGGMMIQGAGTSPRRTRSGKIVKYKYE